MLPTITAKVPPAPRAQTTKAVEDAVDMAAVVDAVADTAALEALAAQEASVAHGVIADLTTMDPVDLITVQATTAHAAGEDDEAAGGPGAVHGLAVSTTHLCSLRTSGTRSMILPTPTTRLKTIALMPIYSIPRQHT